MKSKKASFHAEVLAQFFSYIALVLLFIIFFALFNAKGCTNAAKQDITSTQNSIDSNIELINYLRTPIKLNNKKITMADLIILYYYDKNHKTLLETETKNILDSLSKPSQHSGWDIEITIQPTNKNLIKIQTYNIIGSFQKKETSTYLPLPDSDKYLKVELYLECQGKCK